MGNLPIRVLLVDDHAMVAEAFRRLLCEEADIEVVGVAGCARDALSAADRLRPDVVVMDHQLPDGDGASAAGRMLESLPSTRILMLTGSNEVAVLRAALTAGCVGYLEKTGAVEGLATAVRAAAAGQTVITPQQLRRLHAQTAELPAGPAGLTRREGEILTLFSEGLPNQAIADHLGLRLNTVRTHAQAILEKLGAHSRLEAVAVARREGLLVES